jgi:hypothetical protein
MNKAAVEARKAAAAEKMTIIVDVNRLLVGWRGKVLDVVDPAGNAIPLDKLDKEQLPNLGNTLLNLLAAYRPEGGRRHILVGMVAAKIVEAMEGDGKWTVGEIALGILRDAARQSTITGPVMGQVWEAIGLGDDQGPPTLD